MPGSSPTELTLYIMKLLVRFKRPLHIDEISFRANTTQSVAGNILSKLAIANIVKKNGESYSLNSPDEYQLMNLIT
jgi:predicted transcriptional regulator